jgi:hypothetical protein
MVIAWSSHDHRMIITWSSHDHRMIIAPGLLIGDPPQPVEEGRATGSI